MARKKKIKISDGITFEYDSIDDLLEMRYIFGLAWKQEKSSHHVQSCERYEKIIKCINDEVTRFDSAYC